jgi:hypothetical protein
MKTQGPGRARQIGFDMQCLAVCTQPSSTLLRDRSRTVRRYATRTVTLTSRHIQATPCNTYFERGRWCHDAFYSTSSCCGSAAPWSVRISRHLLCTTSTHLDRIADTKTRAIVHRIDIPACLRSSPVASCRSHACAALRQRYCATNTFFCADGWSPQPRRMTGQPPVFDRHVNKSHE